MAALSGGWALSNFYAYGTVLDGECAVKLTYYGAVQFWYDHTTAQQFAEELLDGATDETVIGIVSAPSVFVKIQEMKVHIYTNSTAVHCYRACY